MRNFIVGTNASFRDRRLTYNEVHGFYEYNHSRLRRPVYASQLGDDSVARLVGSFTREFRLIRQHP